MRGQMGRLFILAAAAALVAALAGCSGAGVAPTALTQSTAQAASADQLTALLLLRSWLGIMYPPPPPPPPGTLVLNRERIDANHIRLYGTDSWLHAFDYTLNTTDQSGSGTWQTPAGVPVSGIWGPQVQSGGWREQQTSLTYPGMTLAYTERNQLLPGQYYPTIKEGTETLTDGRHLQFRLFNNMVDADELRLELPAASLTVDCRVPVEEVIGRGFLPLQASTLSATVQGVAGSLTLAMAGTGVGRTGVGWQQLTLTGPDGLAGAFSLGADLSGSGRLEQGGKLVGALSWPDSVIGRLDLTSLGTVEITPSAAARDLAIDKWISSLAGIGPGGIQ